MNFFNFLCIIAALPAVFSFSCQRCEDRDGCETIQLGSAYWDETLFEWVQTEKCGCKYNCQEDILQPSEPSPSPTPCEDQFQYYSSMLQCSENPEQPGVWVQTNSDPDNCEGYCETPIVTFLPPVFCDDQLYSDYWYQMVQCGENPNYPGKWINTNSDPSNCEGYCEPYEGYSPPPPMPPCDDQIYSDYWYQMMQCGENPDYPGVWTQTNFDRYNCEGHCEGPSPPPPPPCDQQQFTPYWYEMSQCGEDPNNPGVWVETNSDPLNCEGFCNHTGGPIPSHHDDCDIQLLKQECSKSFSGCYLHVRSLEECDTECVCPNCEKFFVAETAKCKNVKAKHIKCHYEIEDEAKCQGKCVCERKKPKSPRMKCVPVGHRRH